MYNTINIKIIKSIVTLLFILLMAYVMTHTNTSYNMPIKFNSADSVMTNFYP